MRSLTTAAVIGCLLIDLSPRADAAKRGGEQCKDNSDCDTSVCKDGKCDPCPDADHCLPPGMCSSSEHASLKEEVGKTCKSAPFSCRDRWNSDDKDADCNMLQTFIERAEGCTKAREKIMDQCFKGGNASHREEAKNARTARDSCQDIINYKKGKNVCYTCSPSDHESYSRDLERAGAKDMVCEGSKDDSKADCSRLEERSKNNGAFIDTLDYLVSRCFNGYRSNGRSDLKSKAEEKLRTCTELLDYKKSKNLCQ